MLFLSITYCFVGLQPSQSCVDAHVSVWVRCFPVSGVRCHSAVVVSEIKCCKLSDTCYIAPLHTELDEGKWPFNRHDSQIDWELGSKASTLPASKASQRLCSPSSSPVAVVLFGLLCNAPPLMSKSSFRERSPCIVCYASTSPIHRFLIVLFVLEVMFMWAWL